MDVSKLPKPLDERGIPDPAPTPTIPLTYTPAPPSLLIAGAEIWLSLIMGILLLVWGGQFGGYAWATVLRQPYHTAFAWTEGPLLGTEVAYPDLQGGVIWSESSIFIFGIALLVEAVAAFFVLARLPGRRALLVIALFTMCAATIYSMVAAAKLFQQNIMPLLSILAVAIGGYLAFHLWAVFRGMPKSLPEATTKASL